MSGGHWDYGQYKIDEIVDALLETDSDSVERMDEQMKHNLLELIHSLEVASVHMQRLDCYLSGDDGSDTYHKRLESELNEFQCNKWENKK